MPFLIVAGAEVFNRLISLLVDTTFSIILSFSAGAVTVVPEIFKVGVLREPLSDTLVSVKPIKSVVLPIPILELVIVIFPALTEGAETDDEAVTESLTLICLSPEISLFSSVTIALLGLAVPLVTDVK